MTMLKSVRSIAFMTIKFSIFANTIALYQHNWNIYEDNIIAIELKLVFELFLFLNYYYFYAVFFYYKWFMLCTKEYLYIYKTICLKLSAISISDRYSDTLIRTSYANYIEERI